MASTAAVLGTCVLVRMPASDARRPLTLVAVGVCLAWLPVVVLWGPAPFTLTFDDAYYYFEIARNVAGGMGSTFDGISHTNGYHPLWLGVCSLAYVVGLDGLAAVRALLVLQLAIWGASLAVVARVLSGTLRGADRRTVVSTAVALALFAANPFVLKMFVNGLESGVTVVVYALLLAGVRWPARTKGLLLALAFLGRTDAVILVGCVALWHLGRSTRRDLVPLLAPPAIVVAVYLAVNAAIFGSPLQISGVVKRVPLTGGRLAAAMGFALVAGAAGVGCRRLTPAARFPRVTGFLHDTGWFAAFCLLLVGYYTVLQAAPYLWYFSPLALYALFLLLLVVADFVEAVLAEGRGLVPVQAILGLPLVVALALQTRAFVDPQLRSLQENDRRAGEWISANLPRDTVLGSWDAGVVGYFTDQPVMNLDGVVNSFEYHDAREAGTAATTSFLRDRGLAYLVNHGQPVDGEDPVLRALAGQLLGADAENGLELRERFDFLYSGSTDRGDSGLRPFAVFVYRIPPPS